MKPRDEINWFRAAWQVIVVLVLVGGFALLAFPEFFSPPRYPTKSACMSHLKQISLGQAMYSADNDDRFSPYYTFDSVDEQSQFIESIDPYTKNRSIFVCPQSELNRREHREIVPLEGLPGKLSYIHCLSFMGQIPKFSDGNRVFDTKTVASPATVPWMREVMATRGNNASSSPYSSAHGAAFVVAFLDCHVKSRSPIDPAREL
ncbi:MAG: hypothetical protein JST51_18165 [Armatimonadetes bacterium]|nr:hypothetical protein [Armatimonadota bacterium]